MAFLKKLFFWGFLAGLIYVLLAFHFIFFSWTDIKLLKKSELSLKYTFYNAGGKKNSQILSVDELRRDGIADILIEEGRMTEYEKERLLRRYY